MSKKKGIIRLVVLLAVIAFVVYTAVSGLGSDRSGSLNDISLGLDLRGGVSITYEAVGDVNSQDKMCIRDSINYNRSAWNHRIAAYEDLSGYEQADVDCSGDQCTEDKSECISGCTEGSECGKSGAGAARAIWCYCAGKTNY